MFLKALASPCVIAWLVEVWRVLPTVRRGHTRQHQGEAPWPSRQHYTHAASIHRGGVCGWSNHTRDACSSRSCDVGWTEFRCVPYKITGVPNQSVGCLVDEADHFDEGKVISLTVDNDTYTFHSCDSTKQVICGDACCGGRWTACGLTTNEYPPSDQNHTPHRVNVCYDPAATEAEKRAAGICGVDEGVGRDCDTPNWERCCIAKDGSSVASCRRGEGECNTYEVDQLLQELEYATIAGAFALCCICSCAQSGQGCQKCQRRCITVEQGDSISRPVVFRNLTPRVAIILYSSGSEGQKLTQVISDAEASYQMYTDLKFSTFLIQEATTEKIRDVLKMAVKLTRRTKEALVVVNWYGHGMQGPDGQVWVATDGMILVADEVDKLHNLLQPSSSWWSTDRSYWLFVSNCCRIEERRSSSSRSINVPADLQSEDSVATSQSSRPRTKFGFLWAVAPGLPYVDAGDSSHPTAGTAFHRVFLREATKRQSLRQLADKIREDDVHIADDRGLADDITLANTSSTWEDYIHEAVHDAWTSCRQVEAEGP